MSAASASATRSPVVASQASAEILMVGHDLSPVVCGKRVRSAVITPNTIDRERDATRKLIKHAAEVEAASDDENDDHVSSPAAVDLYTRLVDEEPIKRVVAHVEDDASPVSTVSSRGSPVPHLTQESTKDDFSCPVCCDVLVRPVDVCGCGHHVCRKHVIDMVTHAHGNGYKCPLCRKEVVVNNYDDIVVDNKLKSTIQDLGLYDESGRSSFRSSRSSTPLQERFNREFFEDETF
ncbi:hypothetical protein Pmar_PMAR012246 [Perkinsus marinus ATCC 50983]|uniref:RING-type domain-containing protein n=3 Tax=Perkinsus marinus (strain ATCC 50983 / TXsc) TaxID=423536 RepID=C5LQK9_PERM5|nr:hypothetical protein Pmar_PMAR012246 [Perkinsus marinus ATCC 50983]EER00984.1 hypothetical protein Pmar_PMAR012246 [Perkinsus marinus ATCC 50983]|eukprot:XP_002768266.1 hypothetical protein Pmar_PMAR012246 [Perkinsus marinus ATCC 50983]